MEILSILLESKFTLLDFDALRRQLLLGDDFYTLYEVLFSSDELIIP
jgi:hypothetical protein